MDPKYEERIQHLRSRLEQDDHRNAQFEETLVGDILRWVDRPYTRAALRDLAERYRGLPLVDLQFLNLHVCPNAPLRLAAVKIRSVHTLRAVELFGDGFFDTKWFEAYAQASTQSGVDAATQAFGLIFNSPQSAAGKYLLLHNANPPAYLTTTTVMATRGGRIYSLEPLRTFVERNAAMFQ